MSTIPGAKLAEDVATRFEVPVNAEGSEHTMTLSELFRALSSGGEFTEYTVERSTLETTFLKVIRENQVLGEDAEGGRKRKKFGFFGWVS
jgi:ATP-binding cassette subfamily A (ABC1) protein 3